MHKSYKSFVFEFLLDGFFEIFKSHHLHWFSQIQISFYNWKFKNCFLCFFSFFLAEEFFQPPNFYLMLNFCRSSNQKLWKLPPVFMEGYRIWIGSVIFCTSVHFGFLSAIFSFSWSSFETYKIFFFFSSTLLCLLPFFSFIVLGEHRLNFCELNLSLSTPDWEISPCFFAHLLQNPIL